MGEHGGDAYTRRFGLTWGALLLPRSIFLDHVFLFLLFSFITPRYYSRGVLFYFLFFFTSPRGTEIGVAMTARDDDDDGKMK